MRLERFFFIINMLTILTSVLSSILAIYISVSFVLLNRNVQTNDYTFVSSAIKYVHDNTHAKFMQDIVVINSTDSCPKDYEPLRFGQYDGTMPACINCGTLLTGDDCKYLRYKYCNQLTDVDAIPPAEIYIWHHQKLCVKYFSDILIGITCPSGYSQCGTGICVPQGELCPITEVTSDLQFTRDFNSNPLVNLSIVSETMPCLSLNQYPIRKDFTAERYPGLGCGKYGTDPFAFLIQAAAAQTILTQNNLWDHLSSVPGYQDFLQETTWNLVGRRLVDVRPREECFNLEFPELDTIDQLLSKSVWTVHILGNIIVGSVFIIDLPFTAGIIVLVLDRYLFENRRNRPLPYVYKNWSYCLCLFDILWIAFSGIIALKAGLQLYRPLGNLKSFDADFKNNSTCFGSLTNPVFLDYLRVFEVSIAPYSNWGKQCYIAGIYNICILGPFLIVSLFLKLYMVCSSRNS